MYDELTRQDIQKMQEEIDYRVQTLRPKLIEDVQTARAFGDLSENFEYKCAKQEKNRNDSRIRYLQRMIKTARIIEDHSRADTAGLYGTVEIPMENTGTTRQIQLVTTLRQDALKGLISKESPVGKAVLGRRAGDRVQVDRKSRVLGRVDARMRPRPPFLDPLSCEAPRGLGHEPDVRHPPVVLECRNRNPADFEPTFI